MKRPTRRSAPASRRVSPPASSSVVPGQKHDTGRQFTTAETIRAEKEILRRMQQGQSRARRSCPFKLPSPLPKRSRISMPAQRSAVEEILTSRDVVQGLQGRAGVGKTTALDSDPRRRRTARLCRRRLRPDLPRRAPAPRCWHLRRHLAGLPRPAAGTAGPATDHLYMVDESSPCQHATDAGLPSQDRLRRTACCSSATPASIRASMPESPSSSCQAGMRTAQLDQIVRQKDPGTAESGRASVAAAKSPRASQLLEQQGRVTEIADPQQRIAAIAQSYAANPDNTIIVSPDNASRRADQSGRARRVAGPRRRATRKIMRCACSRRVPI